MNEEIRGFLDNVKDEELQKLIDENDNKTQEQLGE